MYTRSEKLVIKPHLHLQGLLGLMVAHSQICALTALK